MSATHKIDIDILIYIHIPSRDTEIEIEKTATIECYTGSRVEECYGFHTIDESSFSLVAISDTDGNNVVKDWMMYDELINEYGDHKDLEDYILDQYSEEIESRLSEVESER